MGWGGSDGDTAAGRGDSGAQGSVGDGGSNGNDNGFGGLSDEAGFGPDDNGGGYGSFGTSESDGLGGNDSDFGGGEGNTDIAAHLRSLTVPEQERIFRTVVDPLMSERYGRESKMARGVAKTVFAGLVNGLVPGLGTLANVTGLTGFLTDELLDAHFSNELANRLGLSEDNTIGVADVSAGADVLHSAINAGIPTDQIRQALTETMQSRGTDMSIWDDLTGKSASQTAIGAANTEADYQKRALNYLMAREAIPLDISTGALQKLAGVYGVPGGEGDQQQLVDESMNSPLYQALIGSRAQGEDAILRNASMTGGLRSGNVQNALYDYNVNLANDSLLKTYGNNLSGLQYLADKNPIGAAQIAQLTGGIGSTLAAGQIAAGNARQTGTSNLLGLAGSVYQNAGGVSGIIDTGKSIINTVASWF